MDGRNPGTAHGHESGRLMFKPPVESVLIQSRYAAATDGGRNPCGRPVENPIVAVAELGSLIVTGGLVEQLTKTFRVPVHDNIIDHALVVTTAFHEVLHFSPELLGFGFFQVV